MRSWRRAASSVLSGRIAALVELMRRKLRVNSWAAQCNADLNKSLYPCSVIQSARARWLS